MQSTVLEIARRVEGGSISYSHTPYYENEFVSPKAPNAAWLVRTLLHVAAAKKKQKHMTNTLDTLVTQNYAGVP